MSSPQEQLITPGHQPFFQTPCQEHCFFTGYKIISNITATTTHLNINPTLPTLPFIYNYSTLSPNIITQYNLTPCSIVACKSIGNVPTDRGYCVLFDPNSQMNCSSKRYTHPLHQ